MVNNFFKIVDPEFNDRSISVIHRLGGRLNRSDRMRPVVVRFCRRSTKIDLLRKKKNLYDQTIKGFVKEHLSPRNRAEFEKVRALKKEGKVFAVFTRNCQLCCKIHQNDRKYHVFRVADDIERLLDSESNERR